VVTQTVEPREQRGGATVRSSCGWRRALVPGVFLVALLWLAAPTAGHATECNRAMASPLVHVTLPGSPFTALPSADGCWLFVSLTQGTPGVAVLARTDGGVTLKRTVSLPGWPTGLALTHDGTLLIVAEGSNVVFLDARRLTTGTGNPLLAYWSLGGSAGSIYACVTADDHYLLVSNEAVGTISVIDLAQTRRSRFAQVRVVGSIPVGAGPIGLAFSSDEQFLLATVQSVNDMAWSNRCRPESDPTGAADHPEGAVVVIAMKLATSEPGRSVVRRVPAGCNPVRIVVSRETGRVYVTARGSNELLAFTERGLSGPGPDPRAEQVAVGPSPVGVAVVDNGRKVVVAGSDRFNTGATGSALYVIDAARIGGNSTPLLGVIPCRGFPREIRMTRDGRTLLVTNFNAGTLQIVDLGRAPWEFALSNGEQSNQLPQPTFYRPVTWLTDAAALDAATQQR
jgi:DNA-binding beta-propeller fold protein YncE